MERAAEALGTLGNGWAAIKGSGKKAGRAQHHCSRSTGSLHAKPRLGTAQRPAVDATCSATWAAGSSAPRSSNRRARPCHRRMRRSCAPCGSSPQPDPLHWDCGPKPHRPTLGPLMPSRHPSTTSDFEEQGDVRTACADDPGNGGICVAIHDWTRESSGLRVIDRIAAWVAHDSQPPDRDAAANIVAELEGVGFDRLLAEHREAWARRWSDARVVIEGDRRIGAGGQVRNVPPALCRTC